MEYLARPEVSKCKLCEGTGYLGSEVCTCLLKVRAYSWLRSGGFSERVLNFVSSKEYQYPEIISGVSALNFFAQSPEAILSSGLSLYVFSREAGRGKTTLAYYLAYRLALHFLDTKNYVPRITFAFENVNDLLEKSTSFKEKSAWDSTVYVLDDLGNEDRSTKLKRDAILPILQRLLHYRQDNQLPTIMTSNYAPEDLCGLYQNRLDSLLELTVEGTICGNIFRQVEVGGGANLRTLDKQSSWPSGV